MIMLLKRMFFYGFFFLYFSAGNAVASVATNREVQAKVGGAVASQAARPETQVRFLFFLKECQARIGAAIAANSDNVFVKAAASNTAVQKTAGKVIVSAATNTYVQQKVGGGIYLFVYLFLNCNF